MRTIPQGVGEILDLINDGIKSTVAKNPPFGFVNFDDYSTAADIASIRMSRLEYTTALAFCGVITEPVKEETTVADIDEPLTVKELAELRGATNIGGLGGYALHKATQHELLLALDAKSISDVSYRRRGEVKIPDVGIGSGMKAMGMLAQKGVEAMLANGVVAKEEMTEVLIASQQALPVVFANMARRDNNRTEVLYGIKDGGAYNEQSARYELYQNDTDEFAIAYLDGELVATNFDKVEKVLDTPGRCAAMNHPVFTAAWVQIARNTVELIMSNDSLELYE